MKTVNKEVEIVQAPVDQKHLDSFWYEGLVATCGEWCLYALGEIRIYDKNGDMYDGYKARDSFNIPLENDDDLSKVEEQGGSWDMNNWFELINHETRESVVCGGDFNDSIKELKEIAYD